MANNSDPKRYMRCPNCNFVVRGSAWAEHQKATECYNTALQQAQDQGLTGHVAPYGTGKRLMLHFKVPHCQPTSGVFKGWKGDGDPWSEGSYRVPRWFSDVLSVIDSTFGYSAESIAMMLMGACMDADFRDALLVVSRLDGQKAVLVLAADLVLRESNCAGLLNVTAVVQGVRDLRATRSEPNN